MPDEPLKSKYKEIYFSDFVRNNGLKWGIGKCTFSPKSVIALDFPVFALTKH